MRRLLFIGSVSALLSGCMSAQEQAAAINAGDDAACQSYGAQPGTQPYFQCRMMKDSAKTGEQRGFGGGYS
jgi:hypothetical protein